MEDVFWLSDGGYKYGFEVIMVLENAWLRSVMAIMYV
jgi:hypothetical protein